MAHLTENELTGYLDQALSADERRRVEAHLDACDLCRREAVEVARLLDQPWDRQVPPAEARRERVGWRLPAGIAGLAAAAAIVALLLVGPGGDRTVPAPALERSTIEGVERLATYSPPDGGVVRRPDLRFAWADRGTASYRITITAEDGGLVWSGSLQDTTVVLPSSVTLEAGRRFFWYVDAISAGVVARTGAHSFRIAP